MTRTSRLVFPGKVTTGPITKAVLKKLAKIADEDKATPSDLVRKLRFLDAGVLDRGLSGVRSGSPEESWGMTTAQQGGDV
jgi:hypothetical protein